MNAFDYAPTRYTKIKKSIRESSRIIKTLGFIEFLRIARNEFRKQRMDLFKPDPKPHLSNFNSINFVEDYKIWKEKNRQINYEEIEDRITKFEKKPKICLILFFNEKDSKENLNKSFKSITKQIYDNWELKIFTNQKIDDTINVDSNNDIKIIKSSEKVSVNQELSKTNYEYVGFVKCGDTLSSDALFHVSVFLNDKSNYDLIYTDEEIIDSHGKVKPFFKPDWCPYLYLSMNYISNLFLIHKEIFGSIGGISNGFGNFWDYDLLLKAIESSDNILHIPIPLYTSKDTTSNSEKDIDLGKNALIQALKRRKINAHVLNGKLAKTFRIKYALSQEPKVSIIIPTKDQKNLLKRCIKNLEKNTNYKNWEIIIVDNNSEKKETKSYFDSLPYRIVKYEAPFNFSKMNNLAEKYATGDLLLFLNDDTAAIDPDWLTEMVSICQQPDVGVVGSKLVYSNNLIQHGGMTFLKTGSGFHPFQGIESNDPGYFGFLNIIRDYSAITGACLLIKKTLFEKVGKFDDQFDLYYGDSDLCLKVRQAGYRVIYTPYALLLHEGSSKIKEYAPAFFTVENYFHFIKKWPQLKNGDPCYSPHLKWDYRIDLS